MPKVRTFTVKAKVKGGVAMLDHDNRKENPDLPDVEFDSKDLVKYAQEVSEFNNIETSSIEKMGDSTDDEPYTIDFKIII